MKSKRINISIDTKSYDIIAKLAKELHFSSSCKLMVAFAHILIAVIENKDSDTFAIPEDDRQYIRSVFRQYADKESMPTGDVPITHKRRNIEKI